MFKFHKKKKEEAPNDDSAPASDAPAPVAAGGGSDPALVGKVEKLGVDMTKLEAFTDSFKDFRSSITERFSAINEQVGELRGNLNDTNRSVSTMEVKTIKAVDLVDAVQPDKLMIDVQKLDAKIEAVKSNIESNEEMMRLIKEQMSKMRSQIMVFRGTEQIIKLNEETKNELMDVKKVAAVCEQHADRVEAIFMELQKTYKAFNDFLGELDGIKSDIKDTASKAEALFQKSQTFLTKHDFENRIAKMERDDKKLKGILEGIQDADKRLTVDLKKMKTDLKSEFTNEMQEAKILSSAFAATLEDNPLFAKGLGLDKYIKKKMDSESGGEADDPKAPSKDAKEGSEENKDESTEEGKDEENSDNAESDK